MAVRRLKRTPVGALTIGVLSFLVPACKTPGGPPPPWVRSPDTGSTNVTMRPIFDGQRRRPFYISGYAGANYAPELFGRRGLIGTPVSSAPAQPVVTVEPGTLEPN
jgi:hypothetical protein